MDCPDNFIDIIYRWLAGDPVDWKRLTLYIGIKGGDISIADNLSPNLIFICFSAATGMFQLSTADYFHESHDECLISTMT